MRWAGTASVRVVDPDGQPVEGAFALLGGAPAEAWALTDADGRAQVEVADDGITNRWLTAGKEGWISGGADLDEHEAPAGEVELVIRPLPAADNPDYHFQPAGPAMSMDASECNHCHPTKGRDWLDSAHSRSASNPRTWDLYLGGTDLDDEACGHLGGWVAAGQSPGEAGVTVDRCYTGDGVLPFLHDHCGGPDQDPCDHPDGVEQLSAFGSCGDCHAPAVDGMAGGHIDLARAMGIGHEEGVTCDLCHKVAEVVPGPAPGRDGALVLRRPSEPTVIMGQEFDPINLGPYPDVVVGIMNGSYAPAMREAAWCSSCHEYARGSLRADHPVDGARWPEGLPLHETWSEWAASDYAGSVTCQACHMAVLDEESSTYDISEKGLAPSIDQGWLREYGEILHHDFAALPIFTRAEVEVELTEVEGGLEAAVTVSNPSAGHALPTGEPMRQLMVLVEATSADGQSARPTGGRAVPAEGGHRGMATLGEDASLDGSTLTLSSAPDLAVWAVRLARPTGTWDDYEGPGTGHFDGLSAEDKGLPVLEPVGEWQVRGTSGTTLTLADAPPGRDGDVVYLVGSGDYAGAPGWLYAKVLVDTAGERGVPHYRAVDLASDNRLRSGGESTTTHTFGDLAVEVTATVLYRHYASPVRHRYGWGPEDEVLATVTTP